MDTVFPLNMNSRAHPDNVAPSDAEMIPASDGMRISLPPHSITVCEFTSPME